MSNASYPPPPSPAHPYPAGPQPTQGGNGLAVTGFVLGLLGLLMCWIPVVNILGIMLGILGVIFAAIGLSKSKRVNAGKGLAIAGLIMGILAVILAIVVNVAFVEAVDEAVDEATDTQVEGDEGGDLGTTRDNPAPLGAGITGDDWTVTINSVEPVKKDKYGDTAESGHTLLLINMTATYDGDDEQGETPWATVEYVTADGEAIDSTDAFFIAEDEFDSLKTVYGGGSITGNQILQVPTDGWEDGVLAVSPSIVSDDTFVAVQ